MKVYTKLNEFLAAQPRVAPSKPSTSPTTKPGTKPTSPGKPQRPSPIRRDKPSTDPEPKAKAMDVVKRLLIELKKAKAPINFDIQKLKQRYE